MKLSEYLRLRGESETAFARRAGIRQSTLHELLKRQSTGGDPRISTCSKIVRATRAEPAPGGGTVTFEDLAPRNPKRAEAA